jgi:hypothetical protein
MKKLCKPAAAIILLFTVITLSSFKKHPPHITKPLIKTTAKIQVAILLDVSNSMDGLMEQAKAQLWNMVNILGKAKSVNGQMPQMEIALYEYGRTNNDVKNGYVKQLSAFTTDLDKLSQTMFKLTTNGGEEYCGHVIFNSLDELPWDTSPNSYKVIFISGNEDFLQGDIHYSKACTLAKQKGVIVNTIYCGDRAQGIREHWNLGAECGSGSFTNINQDAKVEDIPTPYDSTIYTLNEKLNKTYIYYGAAGLQGKQMQENMDVANSNLSPSAGLKRAVAKGNGGLYKNGSWDLVDAVQADSTVVSRVEMKTLPDNLKNKSRAQLQKYVSDKQKERGQIQKEIQRVNNQRDAFLVKERSKRATTNTATLETEIEKIIKEQVKRSKMEIK